MGGARCIGISDMWEGVKDWWDDMVFERSGDTTVDSEVIVCDRPGGGAAPKIFEKAASLWYDDAYPWLLGL